MTGRTTPARLALIGCLLVPAAAGAQAGTAVPRLDDLQWLVGCWERAGTQGRRMVERWDAHVGGVMTGSAWSVTDTTARENELLRLFQIGDTLIYEAHPSTQERAPFRATTVSPTVLVFENPRNDFPQRITYRRIGADSLVARIEGDRARLRPPVDFRFRRIECGGIGQSRTAEVRMVLQRQYDEMAMREQQSPGGRMQWLAARAVPGYTYVVWASPGSTVQVWDTTALRAVATQQVRAVADLAPTARRYSATIERVRVFGDSVEVLVTSKLSYRFVDASGRMGLAGEPHLRTSAQRWLDTWVHTRDGYRLLRTAALDEEASLDGRVTSANGRAVAP